MEKEIHVIQGKEMIAEEQLVSFVYKNLGWRQKRSMARRAINQYIKEKHYFYHPLWLIKLLVIAERKPFPPRVTPNMAFVDALSGYRGLFTNIPPTEQKLVQGGALVAPKIETEDQVGKYVEQVQRNINRKYLLKKPKYEIKDTFLVYLPLWFAELEIEGRKQSFIFNVNTGESEEYMARLWESSEWKLV
ncbi:hypothetical protein [Natribacillus halophilus]|uniref:Uncharacterized protein n=1 Tax=Natribacillus halophilus TaxID=549003 RepID=A0A1G8RAD3_9BACI|nr:hypothetical protein [Natribacillus halophilus]SDJ13495.1 hypothetical protein SAMN04488123_11625 [Natribacillus halophilus]